jgi:hypothetical protein
MQSNIEAVLLTHGERCERACIAIWCAELYGPNKI